MKMLSGAVCGAIVLASATLAQTPSSLPADTVIQVVPVQDISSMHMNQGDQEHLQVATDIVENGVIVIPRGSPVLATVTWRTGKGIGGKSAKFDLTFNSVTVSGHQYALKGKHRQEGQGNTVAALLGSMLISGHSAVMQSGQVVNAFTAEAIPMEMAASTPALPAAATVASAKN